MTKHRSDDPWRGLLDLVETLRGPNGCPWDREQTVRTLAPYLVEEAFEVLHAVEDGSDPKIQEESGDLAFVLFLFLITAEQEGRSTIAGTLRETVQKIRARHPHVFAPGEVQAEAADETRPEHESDSTAEAPTDLFPEPNGTTPPKGISRSLALDWERIKRAEERPDAGSPGDPADGAPSGGGHRLPAPHPALPALAQAAKLQHKAAVLGFDWPDTAPVIAKVREELAELEAAHRSGVARDTREELGDLLFAVVNLSRFVGVEPESALRRANRKFRGRFHEMLEQMESDGLSPETSDLEQMDLYWDRAKARERAGAEGSDPKAGHPNPSEEGPQAPGAGEGGRNG